MADGIRPDQAVHRTACSARFEAHRGSLRSLVNDARALTGLIREKLP
jgi:hypothetical protein